MIYEFFVKISGSVVDVKTDIKRTYYMPESIDIEVKVRAARDRVRPSDVVRAARIWSIHLYVLVRLGPEG
jgi:hypothetical protein